MNSKNIKIYSPQNIQDALYYLRTITDLSISAGCTSIMGSENHSFLTFPDSILNIRSVKELCQITKNERFLEFGSCVTLEQIQNIDYKRTPPILIEAVKTIANQAVRNIATIGGNICTTQTKMTLFAPLLALNTKLEFRTGTEKSYLPKEKKRSIPDVINMNIGEFESVKPGYLLTKIRIPIEDWTVSVFRKVGPHRTINENSASFAFLANTNKNIIEDIRIAFCGAFSFQSRELENSLIGNKLPLSSKMIQVFEENILETFDQFLESKSIKYNPILRAQFKNLIEVSLEKLT